MSQWTHVNGSIRIDALRIIGMPQPNLKELFKTASFEDDSAVWDNCNVPIGSEGSIAVSIWENPSDSAVTAYTVGIFGDLRDYEDEEEIVKWFTDIIENKGLMIRDAIISIKIEYKDNTAYGVDDEGKVIKLK
ncbi:MAG: hypothetical protein GY861_01160 [bacterium]|nr:hypothetical protein [bacterium]